MGQSEEEKHAAADTPKDDLVFHLGSYHWKLIHENYENTFHHRELPRQNKAKFKVVQPYLYQLSSKRTQLILENELD